MTVWTLREHIFCVHVCSGPLWLVPSVSWSHGTGSHLHLPWADSQQMHQQAEERKQLREQGVNDRLCYCVPCTRNTENSLAYRVVWDAPTLLMQYRLPQGTQNEQHAVHRWHHVWCCTFCCCCTSLLNTDYADKSIPKGEMIVCVTIFIPFAKWAAPMPSLEMQYCLHYGTQKIKQPILHRWHPFWCRAIYSKTNTECISTLHREEQLYDIVPSIQQKQTRNTSARCIRMNSFMM